VQGQGQGTARRRQKKKLIGVVHFDVMEVLVQSVAAVVG
jgi:hypothetical protein